MPTTNGDNGYERGGDGRFAKGNPGGPGNPYARRVAALRSILLETVTDDDLRDIAKALLSAAKGGDLAATKLLLSYIIGAAHAVVPIDPDRVDLDGRSLEREHRVMASQEANDRLVFKSMAGIEELLHTV